MSDEEATVALPPAGRHIKAIKDFLLQILNTTVAVIIALSFDGLVEWRHNRQLVATAEAQMRSELDDNRKDVRKMRAWIARSVASTEQRLGYVRALIDARRMQHDVAEVPAPEGDLFTFDVVLSATSRATAEATGALGHMSYAAVKRYAGVYEYQQAFSRTVERLAEQFLAVLSLLRDGLAHLEGADLQAARSSLLTLQQLLGTLDGHCRTLLELYAAALDRR